VSRWRLVVPSITPHFFETTVFEPSTGADASIVSVPAALLRQAPTGRPALADPVSFASELLGIRVGVPIPSPDDIPEVFFASLAGRVTPFDVAAGWEGVAGHPVQALGVLIVGQFGFVAAQVVRGFGGRGVPESALPRTPTTNVLPRSKRLGAVSHLAAASVSAFPPAD
jgi:hypothetical protein